MGALALSGVGLSQGNVVTGGDNAPSLKVEGCIPKVCQMQNFRQFYS